MPLINPENTQTAQQLKSTYNAVTGQKQQQQNNSILPNDINQLNELIKSLDSLLRNPAIKDRFNKKKEMEQPQPVMPSNPQPQPQQQPQPQPQQQQPQPQQNVGQQQNKEVNMMDLFVEKIKTEEGRENLVKGLETLKSYVGDVSLTQLINELKGEKIKEVAQTIKDMENKKGD